ncbi:hypothetical protein Dimus_003222 [Dionaea muscipula]
MADVSDLLRSVVAPSEADKSMIIELAVVAMEEMIIMAQAGEPLWIPSPVNNFTEILSEEEHFRSFPRVIGPTPLGLKPEALRSSAIVIMNHMNLVEILMDVSNQDLEFIGSLFSRSYIFLMTSVVDNSVPFGTGVVQSHYAIMKVLATGVLVWSFATALSTVLHWIYARTSLLQNFGWNW